MLFPLGILIDIACFVCWILVLVKIFQNDNVWLGVLGIFCPLFAFIYGWIKSNEWAIQKIMGLWTALVAVAFFMSIVIAHSQHRM
jgi:hypothetical protein